MHQRSTMLIAVTSLGLVSGCVADFEDIDSKVPRTDIQTDVEKDYGCHPSLCQTSNGNILLGNGLNYFYTEFGNTTPEGWSVEGVKLPDGTPAMSMEPTWDGLKLFDEQGGIYEADQLVGSKLRLTLDVSIEINVTIVDHTMVPHFASSGELNAFRMKFDGTDIDVCGDLSLNPSDDFWVLVVTEDRFIDSQLTIVHDGPSIFNLACRGSVAGKIKEHGRGKNDPYMAYDADPMQPLEQERLDSAQAMLKMLAGDFCGTGTSFTVQGTPLRWYDAEGTMNNTEGATNVESYWNKDGATCVNDHRLGWDVQQQCALPACGPEPWGTSWTSVIP